ncbi:RMD1 family protein [Actimicrobium antarcticum]|uniref:DUF155 domain-containing protein n=1 Tax=Actimicrobium antarcticum TaxID=1051899 RepID=A0ABP7TGV2_9BURK
MNRPPPTIRKPRPRSPDNKASDDATVKGLRQRVAKLLISADQFQASALIVAERIDIRTTGQLPIIGQSPWMTRLPGGGVAAIFRYGAVALFAEEPGDREWLLSGLQENMSGAGDVRTEETVWVTIDALADEGPYGSKVRIRSADLERLQLLAEALSKAAMLSFQERRAATDFDRIEPLAQDLADDGKFSVKSSELLKAVGSMLLSEHRLTGRAEVMDRPDVLWDNPHLNGLYARLEGDYELRERAVALERKLATLSRTADTLVETVRYQSSHRVEWYIVLLIMIELVVALWERLAH